MGGNEIARTEWLEKEVYHLTHLRADIDYSEAEALTTYGIIGIKVWIYKGEILQKNLVKKGIKKNATTNKNKI